MSPRSRSLSRAAVLLLAVLAAPSHAAAQDISYERTPDGWVRHEGGLALPVHPGVVTLRFADAAGAAGSPEGRLAEAAASHPLLADLSVVRSNRLGFVDVAVPAGRDVLAVVEALRAAPGVALAEENTLGVYVGVPNDPLFGTQWHLHNTGQSGGTPDADIDAPEAWDIQDGDPSVVVAVLDSGTEWSHPDLAGSIWSNPGETLNGLDDDGNGFVDDVRGWDFDNDDNDPAGPFYHGTAVASCVAARSGNGLQVAGIAGGASDGDGCRVLPCNVGGFSPDASVLDDAILYAADHGVRVIQMSLSVGTSAAIQAALDAAHTAGVLLVCAAGNGGFSVAFPANDPHVMAVASTNRFDVKSGFSNPGPEVEVAAPGESILMLSLGGGTTTDSGTSFAAPLVSGLAALLFSEEPTLSNEGARALLRATADDVGAPGFDTGTGDGRVNAFAALAALDGSFVPGSVVEFGAGLPGSNGSEPTIGTTSLPSVGNAGFGVTLSKALPDALAVLLAGLHEGSLPFAGGTLLVDLGQPPVHLLFTLTAPNGRAVMGLPLPDVPELAGVEVLAQWVVEDPGAVEGYALTPGLRLTVGS